MGHKLLNLLSNPIHTCERLRMTFKDGAFTGLTCTVVTHMQLQRDHRLCSFYLQSPRLDTKQCTYLEVALQLLANEFVVEDAASNWKTGPLRLLHYTLERQKHRERERFQVKHRTECITANNQPSLLEVIQHWTHGDVVISQVFIPTALNYNVSSF